MGGGNGTKNITRERPIITYVYETSFLRRHSVFVARKPKFPQKRIRESQLYESIERNKKLNSGSLRMPRIAKIVEMQKLTRTVRVERERDRGPR